MLFSGAVVSYVFVLSYFYTSHYFFIQSILFSLFFYQPFSTMDTINLH